MSCHIFGVQLFTILFQLQSHGCCQARPGTVVRPRFYATKCRSRHDCRAKPQMNLESFGLILHYGDPPPLHQAYVHHEDTPDRPRVASAVRPLVIDVLARAPRELFREPLDGDVSLSTIWLSIKGCCQGMGYPMALSGLSGLCRTCQTFGKSYCGGEAIIKNRSRRKPPLGRRYMDDLCGGK